LLRVILGLQRPSAGTVTVGGRPTSARDRSIGYVPQKVLLDPVGAEISSTLCDQAIFVDHATDASLSSHAVLPEKDWWG